MLILRLSGPPADSGVSLYAASRFLVGQAREGLLALASLFLVLSEIYCFVSFKMVNGSCMTDCYDLIHCIFFSHSNPIHIFNKKKSMYCTNIRFRKLLFITSRLLDDCLALLFLLL